MPIVNRATILLLILIGFMTSCSPRSEVDKLVSKLERESRKLGFRDLPQVESETSPLLIAYDWERNVISVPSFAHLEPDQRMFLHSFSSYAPRDIFNELFNWYFIAHEWGHFIDHRSGRDTHFDQWENEKSANDFAVAFFLKTEPDRMQNLVGMLRSLRKELISGGHTSSIEMGSDSTLRQAMSNPREYFRFQIDSVLRAYDELRGSS